MRRRLLLVATAAAMLATGGVQAMGAPSSPDKATWRIVGTHTANVALHLRSSVSLPDVWGVKVRTTGHFGGFMIRDAHGAVVLGYLAVTSWHLPAHMAVPVAWTQSGIDRGDYLVTLFADAPTTITIPVRDNLDRTLRPRAPQRLFTATAATDLMPGSPVGSPFASGSVRLPTGRYAFGVVAQSFSGGQSHVGNGDACFASTPSCADADFHCFSSYFSPTGADRGFIIGSESPLPRPNSGTIYAESSHQDTALGSKHAMFVLAVPVQTPPPANRWGGTCGFSFTYG